VTLQPLHLGIELLPAPHKVDQPEPLRGGGVDGVARAEEPLARRGAQPPPRRDADHAGQGAAPDLGEAKGGVRVREHRRAEAGKQHSSSASGAVANHHLWHRRVAKPLEQVAKGGQAVEKAAALEVGLRRVAAEAEVLSALHAAEDEERVVWPVWLQAAKRSGNENGVDRVLGRGGDGGWLEK